MQFQRITVLALALLVIIASGISGGIVRADAIVIGVEADLLSEDPARAVRHRVTDLILGYVYEPFFAPFPGVNGEYQAALATVGVRPSSRRWEFELASRHYLDTGAEVTAEHLAAALQRIIDP